MVSVGKENRKNNDILKKDKMKNILGGEHGDY